jgi:hypothetical protein
MIVSSDLPELNNACSVVVIEYDFPKENQYSFFKNDGLISDEDECTSEIFITCSPAT